MTEPLAAIKQKIWKAMPDEMAIRLQYHSAHGRFPQLHPPVTFTEKVQYRKLFDRDPRLPLFANKAKAKDLVADIIGREFIIPTLWEGELLDPMALEALPRPFLIKAIHSCAANIFIHEGEYVDWTPLAIRCRDWMQSPYGGRTREWLYDSIERKILAEPMIGDGNTPPLDYKIFVFHGVARCVHVDVDRFGQTRTRAILDADWNRLPVRSFYPDAPPIDRPARWDEMKEIAEKIGKHFDFVRVDLYHVDGIIYFGETTFYPASGYMPYDPPSFDAELGAFWNMAALEKETAMKEPPRFDMPMPNLVIIEVEPGTVIYDPTGKFSNTVTDEAAVQKGAILYVTPAVFQRLKNYPISQDCVIEEPNP